TVEDTVVATPTPQGEQDSLGDLPPPLAPFRCRALGPSRRDGEPGGIGTVPPPGEADFRRVRQGCAERGPSPTGFATTAQSGPSRADSSRAGLATEPARRGPGAAPRIEP